MNTNSNFFHNFSAMSTWQWLGYLGLIPFLASLTISVLVQDWHVKAVQVFIFYSAIILSFMAGTLWQVNNNRSNNKQQIASNIFCLLAFLALLTHELVSLIILALGYLGLFRYEEFIAQQSKRERKYMNMRFVLTSVVVVCHVLALYFWSE